MKLLKPMDGRGVRACVNRGVQNGKGIITLQLINRINWVYAAIDFSLQCNMLVESFKGSKPRLAISKNDFLKKHAIQKAINLPLFDLVLLDYSFQLGVVSLQKEKERKKFKVKNQCT